MIERLVPQNRRAERGYSLVEVLVSAGVLGGVLLSISSMFVAGTQSVRSGRDMTRATTIASSAIEEAMTLPFELVYGLTGAERTLATSSWNTSLAIPALTGSPEDVLLMTALLNSWTAQVEGELGSGVLTYRVDGIVRPPTPGNPHAEPYNEATYLRLTITVSWLESRGREREVVFEALVT